MSKLQLENISHSYDSGKSWAVKDVNLLFESGKQYALLGPSGCGKTTLLKIITGLIRPTIGKVLINDSDVTNFPPEKRNVSIVFQFPVVYRMSVLENLMFPLMNVKMSKEEKKEKAVEVAALLGIENILHESATKLGPADRQKVAIGRALIKNSDIILLDEPMSSIEPEKKYEIKKLLLNVGRRGKKTMIFVTHDQTEALTFGEKIAIMSPDGELLQFGTFDEVYHKPANEFVGFFIGFPGMNIIKAQYEPPRLIIGSLTIRDEKIRLPSEGPAEIRIGIRPEHVKIYDSHFEGAFPFKVVYLENLGRNKFILHLKHDDVLIKALSESEFAAGSTVWVYLPPEFLNVFDEKGWRIA